MESQFMTKMTRYSFFVLTAIVAALALRIAGPVKTVISMGDQIRLSGNANANVDLRTLTKFAASAFWGPSCAWVVKQSTGELLITEDGGRAWKSVPPTSVGPFQRLSFIDSRNGWAINQTARAGYVWRTRDGGTTWNLLTNVEFPTTEVSISFVNRLTLIDSLNGWLIFNGTVFRTVDGGVTWERSVLPRLMGRVAQIMEGRFLDSNNGVLVDRYGSVISTVNGGRTWTIDRHHDPSEQISAFFLDLSNGWVIPNSAYTHLTDANEGGFEIRPPTGELSRTADGGHSWRGLGRFRDNELISTIFFVNLLDGWGGGRYHVEDTGNNSSSDDLVSGLLLKTNDGGKSWKRIPLEINGFVTLVNFTDSSHGWIVARDQIFYSDDGGRAWREVRHEP